MILQDIVSCSLVRQGVYYNLYMWYNLLDLRFTPSLNLVIWEIHKNKGFSCSDMLISNTNGAFTLVLQLAGTSPA